MLHSLTELDHQLFRLVFGAKLGTWATWMMVAFTTLGGGWGAILLLPFGVHRSARARIYRLALVLGCNAALVFFLKRAFRRCRPSIPLNHPHVSFAAPIDSSFPSGHAAGSFAFAAFVTASCFAARKQNAGAPWNDWRAWGVISAVYLFALNVGVSRVYLGCHYPLDVVGGALVGTCVGAAGFVLCRGPLGFWGASGKR